VVRPHGRRGEVAAEILTDFPERLTQLSSVALWNGRGQPLETALHGCWLSQSRGGQAIFHFAGSDSISDAEKFVGFEVQIPFTERTTLPENSYFVSELTGCKVFTPEGEEIGTVRDVQDTGERISGTPLLVVDTPQGELLVPLAQEICVKVDTQARRIEAALPDGLRDLNSP
jgi:16S rRNA processing protein RimM